ncbi:hypothetical protein EDC01DRAFT_632550 [Geopyxis carbonaria]|nr:hypothetical protein EDC01DRAFT_632550 [Geopyxis carbonaria]
MMNRPRPVSTTRVSPERLETADHGDNMLDRSDHLHSFPAPRENQVRLAPLRPSVLNRPHPLGMQAQQEDDHPAEAHGAPRANTSPAVRTPTAPTVADITPVPEAAPVISPAPAQENVSPPAVPQSAPAPAQTTVSPPVFPQNAPPIIPHNVVAVNESAGRLSVRTSDSDAQLYRTFKWTSLNFVLLIISAPTVAGILIYFRAPKAWVCVVFLVWMIVQGCVSFRAWLWHQFWNRWIVVTEVNLVAEVMDLQAIRRRMGMVLRTVEDTVTEEGESTAAGEED